MTNEEYLKLVQASGSFKGMTKDMQATILAAKGKQMESYVKIFTDEKNDLIAAKKELVTTTVQVVQQFGKDAKIIISVERKKAEEDDKKRAEQEEEKLLSQINNL